MTTTFKNKWFDYTGIISATLCTIHCIIMPFIMFFQKYIFQIEALSYVFLIISFIAVYNTIKYSSSKLICMLLISSFILLLAGVIFEDDYPLFDKVAHIGSLGLTIGHILNIRYCRKCKLINNEK
jgi:ABC-type iron transport system FetAB permease component